jgi:hypothetical protein
MSLTKSSFLGVADVCGRFHGRAVGCADVCGRLLGRFLVLRMSAAVPVVVLLVVRMSAAVCEVRSPSGKTTQPRGQHVFVILISLERVLKAKRTFSNKTDLLIRVWGYEY